MILQKITKPSSVKAELEQYLTPADIAADILWKAYYNGDIEGKVVVDLGCGTGIFSIGSALLNAKKVMGIDIDEELIEIAKNEAEKFGLKIDFISGDVIDFNERGDTVIMNPPFGAQFANRRVDRIFLKKAMELSNCIYSLHLMDTISFIEKFIEKNGWKIFSQKRYKFPIKASLPFHEKRIAYYDIIMIHARKRYAEKK